MKNFEHYRRGYFMPPVDSTDWVKKEFDRKNFQNYIFKPPSRKFALPAARLS